MPSGPQPNLETPLILSDNPLRREDENPAHFHFEKFAATLARLIADKRTDTPLTIGVSGSWGSGKTTLLRRLQRQLDQTRHLDGSGPLDFVNDAETPMTQFRTCRTAWFNAWKYADEDELLVALVRVIVQEMFRDDFVSQLEAAFWEPFTPRRDVIDTVFGWFSIKTPFGDAKLNKGKAQPTPLAAKTALLDQFDDAFDKLMAAWVHHKTDVQKIDPQQGVLAIFIDDLDRCLPEKVIKVLEAIKLFLDKPGCIFVLGADEDLIEQAVTSHYKDIQGQKASDYLEKVIQMRFHLPPVTTETMQDFLEDQKVDGEMLQQWQTLIAAAEINPRRVKAVVNDIALQWAMLVNSGQALGVQRDDFIRWSALMRAASPAFKKLIIEIDDDPAYRFEVVQKALDWACGRGDETVRSQFEKFEPDGRRLRRVLRAIGEFGKTFDAHVLDAIIHLTAPPPKPVVIAETLTPGTLKAGDFEGQEEMPVRLTEKGARARTPGGVAVETWGGIEFVRVPKGKFRMGSSDDDGDAQDWEKPQHTVEITAEYGIGRYPITNAQFRAFIEANPGYKTTAEEKGSAYAWTGSKWEDTKGANWQHPRGPDSSLDGKDDHPVVCVSWLDAVEYCRWLNQAHAKGLLKGWQFRLPTEAEWEKAARGELGNLFPWGSEEPDEKRCNFNMNVGDTTLIGQYSPQGDSPYGCADMAGNVWEWCADWFDEKYYASSPAQNPAGPPKGAYRVLRGGSFRDDRGFVRCALRGRNLPVNRLGRSGFRLAASPILANK